MKRKKTVWILALVLLAVLAALGVGSVRRRTESDFIHYTDDYSEIYKNQLQIIFGEGYGIGEKETIVVEGEDCDCGFHSDGYEYYEWEIVYQDQNGRTFTQTLNNMRTLESQQLSWLNSQLRQYYTQKYLVDFFKEGTFEDIATGKGYGRTYCSVGIGNPVGSYTSDTEEEYKRIQKAGKEYTEQLLKQLQDEKNMIRLQEVDYENIFNCFPVKVGFYLSMNDRELSGAEKADFEMAVQERVMEMIQEIKKETNDTCNLRIQVNSANGHCDLYDGSRDWRYFILQGERMEPEDAFDGFEWQFFYAYEGIYW